MSKRSVALLAAVLFALSGIMVKLMQLTSAPFSNVSGAQSTVTVTVARGRGTIYDRDLNPLTNTESEYTAAVIAEPEAMAALSKFLPPSEWEEVNANLQNGKPVTLTSDTAFPIADGIRQFAVPKRYANRQTAAHVIGYMKDDGLSGACGIEKAFDEELGEASGSITVSYQTDGRGNVLIGGDVQVSNTLFRADAGIALTLDSRLQHLAETVAGGMLSKGAAVILDPKSGDVLALASFPGFSPNDLASYLERDDSPLFNRALASYNCGSVFKIVSSLAALESGIPLTQSFTCTGALTVGENRVKCHHILGHGVLDMCGGFAQSCNPYYIQLMQLCGSSPLYRTACLFGFDSPILLAEGYGTARATIPSEQTISQESVLANVSFGQGDLLASPIHIAQMTACMVNGGFYYRPNLYAGAVDVSGNLTPTKIDPPIRVCSASSAAIVKDMMIAVVENGTGTAAKPKVGGAGGKTGTAQTGWVGEDGETMVQNWFTGFYPADDPQYVITVLAEDSGRTGESTASVFAQLCDALYRMGYVHDELGA
ncbi:MAG: penicillin-binding protein 2 [Clostridia bacterium]|nr:penicillin-binding protein 2 [Clostridia bacterium]